MSDGLVHPHKTAPLAAPKPTVRGFRPGAQRKNVRPAWLLSDYRTQESAIVKLLLRSIVTAPAIVLLPASAAFAACGGPPGYAAATNAGANVLVNGTQQSALVMKSTGSWNTYTMSPAAAITLPAGNSVPGEPCREVDGTAPVFVAGSGCRGIRNSECGGTSYTACRGQ